MGIILDTIKEKFGFEQSFSSWDLHLLTKINVKVIQMILKKMHNNEILYLNNKYDIYYLKTDEQIFESRKKINDFIDKYNLQNKKYKI